MSLCHHATPSPSRSISLSSGVLKRPVHRLIITLAFVTVLIGTHNHGQGHETTFAQIVGEKLGVPFENIDIVFGDTDKVQFGMGTYGSRSLVVGGPALAKASDKVIAKGKKIAAHLLEASEQDITFERGTFSVIGTDRKKTLADIALAAYVPHDYPLE